MSDNRWLVLFSLIAVGVIASCVAVYPDKGQCLRSIYVRDHGSKNIYQNVCVMWEFPNGKP